MHANIKMQEHLFSYDLVVVHYYNSKQQDAALIEERKQIFKNAITAYREFLQLRIDSGEEVARRVRFAECDYGLPDMEKHLIQPERIQYPNIVVYLFGQSVPFYPFSKEGATPEEIVNYLSEAFLHHSNFWLPSLTCDQFKSKREENEQMVVYFGPFERTKRHQPLYTLNHLKIFDRFSFAKTVLNLYVFDYDRNPQCLGQYGLPAEREEDLIFYLHSEIAPIFMAGNEKHWLEKSTYLDFMTVICRHAQDMTMGWSKCSFFLMDHQQQNALVLLTEDRVLDPQADWRGSLVIAAYEIGKQGGQYMVPIISTLEDDSIPADIPQLHQVLAVSKEDSKFPRLFVINAREGTAVEYPVPLDDPLDFAPELLLLWARRTILYQDIKFVKNKVSELNETIPDEQHDTTEEAFHYAEVLKKLKEELKVVKEKHDEINKQVQIRKAEAIEQI